MSSNYHITGEDVQIVGPLCPGDRAPRFPNLRYTLTLQLSTEDAACLKEDVWLSTAAFLDYYILQRTAFRPNSSTESSNSAMMGDFRTEAFMSSMNLTASLERDAVATVREWNKLQGKVDIIRNKFKHFLNNNMQDGDVPKRLIFRLSTRPIKLAIFLWVALTFL